MYKVSTWHRYNSVQQEFISSRLCTYILLMLKGFLLKSANIVVTAVVRIHNYPICTADVLLSVARVHVIGPKKNTPPSFENIFSPPSSRKPIFLFMRPFWSSFPGFSLFVFRFPLIFSFFLVVSYCAPHDFLYIRGWIQMAFLLPYDLFSWNR